MMRFQIKFLASALAAILLIGGSAVFVQSVAIRGISGLAVAQSSTRFNAVKDGAAGDALSSGVLVTGMYSFNGATFDRLRGTIANGLDVDLTRLPGTQTLADNLGNPSSALPVGAYVLGFDGSTWDRIRGDSTNGLDVRVTSGAAATQSGTLFNSLNVSADDSTVSVTITGAANEQIHLYKLIFRCQQNVSTDAFLSVADGIGNDIYNSKPGNVSTDETIVDWAVPLTGSTNTDMIIALRTCGAGNFGVVQIQADRF